MDYIKECAHELKDNAREFSHTTQDFWKNANLLTKTAVVLGVSGASGYILLNEWRNRWNKARIKELEKTELVVGAIAYGGFNSSRDKILEKIHEDKQTNKNNTRKVLFEGKMGIRDHHPKTHTFLTKQINKKLFDYGEASGYLLRNELKEKNNKLKKLVTTLFLTLFDVDPNDLNDSFRELKDAKYPDHFSCWYIPPFDPSKPQDNPVPQIIKKLKKKFHYVHFKDKKIIEAYKETEKKYYSDDDRDTANDNSEEEDDDDSENDDFDDNENYGGPWDTIQNSEGEKDEQEIAMNPFRAFEDRVAYLEKKVKRFDKVFFKNYTFKQKPEKGASAYEKGEYYEALRTQAWNSIAWNKHSYTVEIATMVCNKLIAEAENKAALRKQEKHLLA
jgi:type II secretory pathway pseudopilin PulG